MDPEYSLERLMLKLKLQYFGHLIWRADSLEKTLMLGKSEGRRRRGWRGWDGWMASSTQWAWIWANSRRQWRIGKPGMLQSMGSQNQTQLSDWTTTLKRCRRRGWKWDPRGKEQSQSPLPHVPATWPPAPARTSSPTPFPSSSIPDGYPDWRNSLCQWSKTYNHWVVFVCCLLCVFETYLKNHFSILHVYLYLLEQ